MSLRDTLVACGLWLACSAMRADVAFNSTHVLVVDEATDEVLLSKNGETVAPIASLTKLMTAMVVLDAQQDPNEILRIDAADTDHIRHSRGGVPVGPLVSRGALLELALLASDNRAASAPARNHPGGLDAFGAAMQRKIHALGLYSTQIEEPTGLSPNNVSSAQDLIKVLRAAARYPDIAQMTSQRSRTVVVNGRPWMVRSTNRLVGAPGWQVLLSKTGFTNDAGRLLAMRAQAGGRTVTIVLMGAAAPSQRTRDALAVRRWLTGGTLQAAASTRGARVRVAYQPAPRPQPTPATTLEAIAPGAVYGGLAPPMDRAADGVEADAAADR